ncbi:ester cyclase [Hymenobacter rubidus]|uniref:ester cyclase n=1 Tax=Hymenobacter rubidus TaxID=1441626 RepID=UPI00191D5F9A|nr:ester cyclase [Hymenobacter rubidus]
MSRIDENKEAVRRFLEEIWSKGDQAAMEEVLAPDFQFILAFAQLDGREAYKNLVIKNHEIFADLTYSLASLDDVVADEQKAAAFWSMSTSNHRGTWRNVPASGEAVAIKGMTFFRFNEAGKMTEARVQNDVLKFMLTIGGVKKMYDI